MLRLLRDVAELSGFELSELAGIGVGDLYPALMLMESGGEIVSRWRGDAYPRKKLYRLSAKSNEPIEQQADKEEG